jgi:hypothetical protein
VPEQTKLWYRRWWGVIVVVCIWPFFLAGYAWSKATCIPARIGSGNFWLLAAVSTLVIGPVMLKYLAG